jgi:hypothetical protein
MLAAGAILAVVIVVAVGAVALADQDEPAELRPSELTVEQLYARVSESLGSNGEVVYVGIQVEGTEPYEYKGTTERWIDTRAQVARERSVIEGLVSRTAERRRGSSRRTSSFSGTKNEALVPGPLLASPATGQT